MKRLKTLMIALAVAAIPLLALAGTAHAADFRSGNNMTVGENEVIDHTLFITGQNLDIKGTINGDVFCAGQNIQINAKVNGDVICAGNNVRIGGQINGDVRAAGQNVSVSATVADNATLAGNSITVDKGSAIHRDLQAAGEAVVIDGNVTRDLDTAGSAVTINGTIGRDTQAASENITLGDTAKLDGNLTYYSHNQLHQASGAQIAGKTTQEQPKTQEKKQGNAFGPALFSALMFLTFAFALLALFPRTLGSITNNALARPGMTALLGIAVGIIMPIAIVVTFLTVIGVYIGVVLLLAWLVVLALSGVFASYYLGRLVFSRSPQNPFVMMLVGLLIIALLLLIPFINALTVLAILVMGVGMVVREIINRFPKPRYNAPAVPARGSKSAA